MGVCNHRRRPLHASPRCLLRCFSAGKVSAGASAAAGHSAITYGVGRSADMLDVIGCAAVADLAGWRNSSVNESFRRAPNCSCEARMALRILRANHRPAARKANCARRLPSAYQLLCIQPLNSFMIAPWPGSLSVAPSRARQNWHKVQETGRPLPAPAFHH